MSAMQIKLSQQPAAEQWGKNALLSADQNGMTIHLQQDELNSIQKAARKIKNQGILSVELTDEGWGLEQCWAFQQGFVSVKIVALSFSLILRINKLNLMLACTAQPL